MPGLFAEGEVPTARQQAAMFGRRLVFVPLLGLATSAAARVVATAPAPAPAPPNGTYTYALSRNGGAVGTTTVVLHRRDDVREIETDEAGSAAAAYVHVLASYRYADLGVDAYAATYQAPFLRVSPLGRSDRFLPAPDYGRQTTVRYRALAGALAASIDGTPISDLFGVPPDVRGAVRNPWIFDAPFMTGVLLLPAFRHRSNEALLLPVSEAFPPGTGAVLQRLVRSAPVFAKTPKTDLAVDVPGVARVWFDPKTFVVHEAHFFGENFDARLVSYVRGGFTAPFVVPPAAASVPAAPVEAATFASADGTSLHASLQRPSDATAKSRGPAVVLIAPGPGAGIDYDGDGPTPMFPALAAALVARGYAVLRYDMRGVGKSGGTVASETWEQGVADAQAALDSLAADDTLDPKRIYALGFGNGADVALAATAASSAPVAGVVALAPTVLSYRDCASAIDSGAASAAAGAWRTSSRGHDPRALAARVKAPLLVIHPGLPVCGETNAQIDAYDDALRAAVHSVTIVAARDLSQRFGSRYDAEAPLDTEEFFPYRFDASTGDAIADWLDNPKSAGAGSYGLPAGAPAKPPPPPPGVDEQGAGLPNPHASGPARRSPAQSVEPGVVLPSGATPPPFVAPPPTATPVPTPRPTPTATPSPTPSPTLSPATPVPSAATPATPATKP